MDSPTVENVASRGNQGPVAVILTTRMALLQTRCGCSRVIALPEKATRTVTVDLMPLKGQSAPEKRTFYLAGETMLDGQMLMVYREGPNPDRPRIIIPGVVPPKNMRTA